MTPTITPKQQKAAQLLAENGRNGKPTRSKGAILKEVGYSDDICKTPNDVTNSIGFKEAAKPFVQELIEQRAKAVARATKTVGQASYSDAIKGIDKLTKNIELLSGRHTERVDITDYSNLTNEQLDDIINKGRSGESPKDESDEKH